MSVFYFMSSFGYGEPLKKILSCEAGYSAYEYEYTYHLVCLDSSYYPRAYADNSAWVLVVIAPYWEERG